MCYCLILIHRWSVDKKSGSGTLGYMSPEMLSGQAYDFRTEYDGCFSSCGLGFLLAVLVVIFVMVVAVCGRWAWLHL